MQNKIDYYKILLNINFRLYSFKIIILYFSIYCVNLRLGKVKALTT